MKRLFFLVFLLIGILSIFSCISNNNNTTTSSHDGHHAQAIKPTASTGNFGAVITTENAIQATELPLLLAGVDSIQVKLTGNIESVCQMSGCWMDMEIGNGETIHVTFKNDAFLLPKDAAGKKAVVEGIGQREELSVEYLKHMAEDEGKSQEEIDAITQPRMEYTFIATGVIIE